MFNNHTEDVLNNLKEPTWKTPMPTLEPKKHSPKSTTHWGCGKHNYTCCGCYPNEHATRDAPGWEEEFEDKFNESFYRSDTDDIMLEIAKEIKSFIATQIAEAEARGKQQGADIAMAVKLSSQDQLETYVAGLAMDLIPIKTSRAYPFTEEITEIEKAHNEAVLKLSNIKN